MRLAAFLLAALLPAAFPGPTSAGQPGQPPAPAAWSFTETSAWSFAAPSYARMRARAVEAGKPLAVFVGVTPRDVPGCYSCGCASFEGCSAPCVVVGVPAGGELYWAATLPPGATDVEIQAACNPLPIAAPSPAGLPLAAPAAVIMPFVPITPRMGVSPVPAAPVGRPVVPAPAPVWRTPGVGRGPSLPANC